jgi:hypothetical protein
MDQCTALAIAPPAADRHLLCWVMCSLATALGLAPLQVTQLEAALRRRLRLARRAQATQRLPSEAIPPPIDGLKLIRRGLELAARREPDALQLCAQMLWCSEECWDGGGRPQGLRGLAIPLAARIFAVANAYASLLDQSPTIRGQVDAARCLALIQAQRGRAFDPAVVDALHAAVGQDGKVATRPRPGNASLVSLADQVVPAPQDGPMPRERQALAAGAVQSQPPPVRMGVERVVEEVLGDLLQLPSLDAVAVLAIKRLRDRVQSCLRLNAGGGLTDGWANHPAEQLATCIAAAAVEFDLGAATRKGAVVWLEELCSLAWYVNRAAGILEANQHRGSLAFQWALEDFQTWVGWWYRQPVTRERRVRG